MTYPEGRAPIDPQDMAKLHPSTFEAECKQLRARVAKLEAALRDIADGMGEMTHREIGQYAPAVARAALQQEAKP